MRVSDHAAVRWIERVEGFSLDHVRAAVKSEGFNPNIDGHVLHQLRKMHGISVESIAERMATPVVMAAIKAGAKQVCSGGAVLRLDGGTVVTVITNRMKQRGLRHVARTLRPETLRGSRVLRNIARHGGGS